MKEQVNLIQVITSTWRKYENDINILLATLKSYDLDKNVIGYTSVLNTKREEEIKEYLNNLDESVNFVIIDDIRDMSILNDNLIVTSPKTGLTKENVKLAIKILRKG